MQGTETVLTSDAVDRHTLGAVYLTSHMQTDVRTLLSTRAFIGNMATWTTECIRSPTNYTATEETIWMPCHLGATQVPQPGLWAHTHSRPLLYRHLL